VLIRTNAPVFGASEQLTPVPGEWQFGFNYRGLESDDHYSGTQFQYQRESTGNYVINTQQLYDLSLSYNFTERITLFASLPIVNASWSLPTPPQPPLGPRREQNSSGIGDISALARFWMRTPAKHPNGNFSLGIGFKAPTGDYANEDEYPNINGTNDTAKAVDMSIQPGDGGWGILFDMQGYKRFQNTTFYGSGTYLANPRDTNGTPSIIVGLGFGANPAFADLVENTVPDQYVARAGASFGIPKASMALSLGFRIEGVPRYDLIGESHGFRRPGYETFIEPGIAFNYGRNSWSLFVPKGLVRNRLPNPYTGAAGDATFPDYIVLLGYSYRFGGALPALNPIPDVNAPQKPIPTPTPTPAPDAAPGGAPAASDPSAPGGAAAPDAKPTPAPAAGSSGDLPVCGSS